MLVAHHHRNGGDVAAQPGAGSVGFHSPGGHENRDVTLSGDAGLSHHHTVAELSEAVSEGDCCHSAAINGNPQSFRCPFVLAKEDGSELRE